MGNKIVTSPAPRQSESVIACKGKGPTNQRAVRKQRLPTPAVGDDFIPVIDAAKIGDSKCLEALIMAGHDVNSVDKVNLNHMKSSPILVFHHRSVVGPGQIHRNYVGSRIGASRLSTNIYEGGC